MDLQTRKLNAIKYLIQIQDEKLFNKIESVINESKDTLESKRVKPFTKNN
ncbi:MAG: hypothetical protein AB2L20_25350 [Mangrovibacterium sp.]